MPNTDPAEHSEGLPEEALEIEQLDDVAGGTLLGTEGLHNVESSQKNNSESMVKHVT